MVDISLSDARYQRGLIATGDRWRWQALLKQERPLVYAGIGGSITQGASATAEERCYVSRFGRWLDQAAPAGCRCINAGIGASNSFFGAFRVAKDVLAHDPDIVTVEYAVNDVDNGDRQLSLESLIRQCRRHPSRPLVILIFTMRRDGGSCQDEHVAVGGHFGLPMLSYRDALYPDIEAGGLRWEDISPDEVHPNDDGHALIAAMLARLLDESVADEAATTTHAGIGPRLAASTTFDEGRIVDAATMTVDGNHGWTSGPHKGGYTGFQSSEPGAELQLRFSARFASLGYQKFAGDFGRVEVQLDDEPPLVLEGFYEKPLIQAWAGGHTVLATLLDADDVAEHRLRIRLLDDRHAGSNGHRFDIGYLLLS